MSKCDLRIFARHLSSNIIQVQLQMPIIYLSLHFQDAEECKSMEHLFA